MTGMLSPLEIGSTPGAEGGSGGEGAASGPAQPAVVVVPAPAPAEAIMTSNVTLTVAPTPIAAPASAVPVARVPSDWPANMPIPPIPPGCGNPVLALNGQWGCQ
jgi:hypothetical protein